MPTYNEALENAIKEIWSNVYEPLGLVRGSKKHEDFIRHMVESWARFSPKPKNQFSMHYAPEVGLP